MPINTTRWDSAEHLKTEEDIQLYLEACFEEAEDDLALIIHALGVIARAKNMSQLSRDTDLSREGYTKHYHRVATLLFLPSLRLLKPLDSS